MISDKKIFLKPISRFDYIFWKELVKKETSKFITMQFNFGVSDFTKKQFIEFINRSNYLAFVVVTKKTQKKIGYVYLSNIDFSNMHAESGMLIDEEYIGLGYGIRGSRLLYRIAHDYLRLKKIYYYVNLDNDLAMNLQKNVKEYQIVGLPSNDQYLYNEFFLKGEVQ